MTTQRLEVRCCCQPQKLLGWLPVPAYVTPAPGVLVRFTVKPPAVYVRVRTLRELELEADAPMDITHLPPTYLSLPIALWGAFGEEPRLAFKSEEVALEQLRDVPGFEEAPHAACRSSVVPAARCLDAVVSAGAVAAADVLFPRD